MAIGSVGNNTALTQALFSSTPSVAAGRYDDGDNDAPPVSGAGGGGGRFANAISQALTQMGVTAADGTTASTDSTSGTSGTSGTDAGTSATQDPAQAQQAFAQALFGALQSQNGSAAQGSDASHKGGGGHHHHGGGGGVSKIESGLQNLIKQLSASSATSASGATGSSAATTTTATTDSSALSQLQTNFNSMVAANGGTSGSGSLTTFLQNLAQNLQGAPSSGNVVSTKA